EYLEYSDDELYSIFSYLGEIEVLNIAPFGDGARVTIYYWSYVGTAVTGLNGLAQLKLLESSIEHEIHGVRAVFIGNDYYEGCIGTGQVTISLDSDWDGLNDQDEVNIYGTDPTSPDTDFDGLTDGEEILKYGTDPLIPDSDDHGLSDGDEIFIYSTNPLNWNTDGDPYSDLEVVLLGINPLSINLEIEIDFMPLCWPELLDYAWIYTYYTVLTNFGAVTISGEMIPFQITIVYPLNYTHNQLTDIENSYHTNSNSLYVIGGFMFLPVEAGGVAYYT
ncbi:MAG: binary toxin-like calcium binding domain-containing protein, partial [Candidatus Helarchaeota archaeon]